MKTLFSAFPIRHLLHPLTTGDLSSCHCCASHQCWIIPGSDLEVILKPRLPSLAPCGGRWRYLVAESYTCQLVEPRSTPHFLDANVWRELPSLTVTSATLQFPPHALQGSIRVEMAAGHGSGSSDLQSVFGVQTLIA